MSMDTSTYADLQEQRPAFRRPRGHEPGVDNPAVYTVESRGRPVGHVQRTYGASGVRWASYVWPPKRLPRYHDEHATRQAAGWAIVRQIEEGS